MTLKITVSGQGVRRHIAAVGRLTYEEISELEQAIQSDSRAAYLDLAELRSADAAGLAALRRLRAEGVILRGVPPHLAWRIEGDPGRESG